MSAPALAGHWFISWYQVRTLSRLITRSTHPESRAALSALSRIGAGINITDKSCRIASYQGHSLA